MPKREAAANSKLIMDGIPTEVWAMRPDDAVPSFSELSKPMEGTSATARQSQEQPKSSSPATFDETLDPQPSTSSGYKRKRDSLESLSLGSVSVYSEGGARKKAKVSSSSGTGSVNYEVDENGGKTCYSVYNCL